MQIGRRVLTIGTTFFLAAATGHVMQNGDTIGERMRMANPHPSKVVVAIEDTSADKAIEATAEQPTAVVPIPAKVEEAEQIKPQLAASLEKVDPMLPNFPDIPPTVLSSGALLSESVKDTSHRYAQLTHHSENMSEAAFNPVELTEVTVDPIDNLCGDTQLTLGSVAPAMLRLSVSAPCHLEETVTVRHAGLVFSAKTDAVGNYSVLVPALEKNGAITVEFAGHERLRAAHKVDDLDNYLRTALQWIGASAFHLNAFENGAQFGGDGHINFSSPGKPDNSNGGFLTVLGDPTIKQPLLAEVYTAPKDLAIDAIQIEAAVTEAFCGRSVAGQKLSLYPGMDVAIQPVVINMPSCDAVGDFVVMNLASVSSKLHAIQASN
jgi:hypothetical protein